MEKRAEKGADREKNLAGGQSSGAGHGDSRIERCSGGHCDATDCAFLRTNDPGTL